MNIAIYLGPHKGATVDASQIDYGNPGIGGTQYCMLKLAHYLNTNSEYKIYVIATREHIVEEGIYFYLIDGDNDVCQKVTEIGSDILILSQFVNYNLENEIAALNCRVIIWSHNYILYDFCKFIKNTNSIKVNVFVGKQQYDRYIDDDVMDKSIYIHNMFTDNTQVAKRENDGKTVVYMGAIIQGKGFAELCQIWQKVLIEVPDAQLLVMGDGKLYGNSKLGKYGIAAEEYENSFMPYITNNVGKIIPSVKFLGIVGCEKSEIFRQASVGIVNPSGRTETFGMGVVEMAEMSLPVVTIGKNGHFDTVLSGQTGLLSTSLKNMSNDIIRLLKDKELNCLLGKEAKKRIAKFNPEVIGPKWVSLLEEIYNGSYKPQYIKAADHFTNNQKWIRILIRFFRFTLGLKFIPSMIRVETFGHKLLTKI